MGQELVHTDPGPTDPRRLVHQINNDLAVAVGQLDLLLEQGDLPLPARVQLDRVIGTLDRAASRLRQLNRNLSL